MENIVCFYTREPFWTGEKPDIDSLVKDEALFTKTLSEKTKEFENENLYLAFCKDGLVMTKIKELESRRGEFSIENKIDTPSQFTSEYLAYLNAIQILFSSTLNKIDDVAQFQYSNIRSKEAFTMTFKDGKLNSVVNADHKSESFFSGRNLSNYKINYPIKDDHRIGLRRSISTKVFEKCFEDLNLIIEDIQAIHMLSQLNSALTEYHELNFRQSLVQAWFVIEYYINKKWIKFLQSKQGAITKDKNRLDSTRRDFLTGRDITSSIMSNILELNDLLAHDIFEKINTVRGKRNIAVHNIDLIEKLTDKLKTKPGKKKDKSIHAGDCFDAFKILINFFKSEHNLDLKINANISHSTL